MDTCHCLCHSGIEVKHCMPCCRTCPICGVHINFLSYDSHVKECRDFHNKIIDLLRKED